MHYISRDQVCPDIELKEVFNTIAGRILKVKGQ